MNENDIIKSIKSIAGNEYIGDDCAYLKELGIVVTQDTLVENIHFKRKWCTPFQLGYKAVVVNISDVLASGAEPLYITISLSLPNNIPYDFTDEFYKGAVSALNKAKIIGGDITGSNNDIIISVTAIGSDKNRHISSRKHAKSGYIIVTNGLYGSSALGLKELINNGNNMELINAHLLPKPDYNFSEIISTTVIEPYAMMDTSDGIADALFKIAEESGVKAIIDYNTIPHLSFADVNTVLYGGEDYHLVAAVPKKYLNLLHEYTVIGEITEYDGIRLDISGKKFNSHNELNTFNHFNINI